MQRASHRDYFTFLGFLFIYYDFLSVPALLILTYAGRPDIQYRTYGVDFHVRPLGKENRPESPPLQLPDQVAIAPPQLPVLKEHGYKIILSRGHKSGIGASIQSSRFRVQFRPILHPPIRWVAFPLTSPPTCSIALLHQ